MGIRDGSLGPNSTKPTPMGATPEGFGTFIPLSALCDMQRVKVKQILEKHPHMLELGIGLIRIERDTAAKLKQLELDMRAIVGADGVKLAFELFRELEKQRPVQSAHQPANTRGSK